MILEHALLLLEEQKEEIGNTPREGSVWVVKKRDEKNKKRK